MSLIQEIKNYKPFNEQEECDREEMLSYMENNASWHGKAPNDELFAVAMEDLNRISEELEKAGEA